MNKQKIQKLTDDLCAMARAASYRLGIGERTVMDYNACYVLREAADTIEKLQILVEKKKVGRCRVRIARYIPVLNNSEILTSITGKTAKEVWNKLSEIEQQNKEHLLKKGLKVRKFEMKAS